MQGAWAVMVAMRSQHFLFVGKGFRQLDRCVVLPLRGCPDGENTAALDLRSCSNRHPRRGGKILFF